MMDWLALLKQSKVDWQKTTDSPYLFRAVFQGKSVHLRLNDFPDEPLCTAIIDGKETNLDDFPKSWTLPRHRGEE